MDNQSSDMSNGNTAGSRRNWPIIAAVIVAVVALCALFLWLLLGQAAQKIQPPTSANAAAEKFYTMLAKAASQPRIHLGMYRETFANKADADNRKNPGFILSSVSELDTTQSLYRSVWSNNQSEPPAFAFGRCMDGKTYWSYYGSENPGTPPTNLKDVPSQFKLAPEGHLHIFDQPLNFITCKYLGMNPPGISDNLANSRLSDGVYPVGLNAEEAQTWKQKVSEADPFTVKDEGTVQKNGQTLRKLSFSPKDEETVNRKLYDIFYQAANIESIKQDPNKLWHFLFVTINPEKTGSVGGFYLVDEKTNLPVYSELYGTNPDKASDVEPSVKSIARTRQNYSFPPELTITLDTPLEFLE